MKLIIGLGNPGLRYSATRHNIGFKVVKLLAKRHRIRINKKEFAARTGTGLIAGHKAVLALPQMFMNLSGAPVKALIGAKKIAKADLLVVCDDVNLKYGCLRLKAEGSAGGHKGLKSVIECLGRDDFARLRVGVGKEGLSGGLTDFVLGDFTRQEKIMLPDVLKIAQSACESWVESGAELTSNRFNRKVK